METKKEKRVRKPYHRCGGAQDRRISATDIWWWLWSVYWWRYIILKGLRYEKVICNNECRVGTCSLLQRRACWDWGTSLPELTSKKWKKKYNPVTINSSGDKVSFAPGNLQYQATTNTWRFAPNQWDAIGNDNQNVAEDYSGWIDMFAWGTSGYNHGALYYQPWSQHSSTTYSNGYYAYGDKDSTFSNPSALPQPEGLFCKKGHVELDSPLFHIFHLQLSCLEE